MIELRVDRQDVSGRARAERRDARDRAGRGARARRRERRGQVDADQDPRRRLRRGELHGQRRDRRQGPDVSVDARCAARGRRDRASGARARSRDVDRGELDARPRADAVRVGRSRGARSEGARAAGTCAGCRSRCARLSGAGRHARGWSPAVPRDRAGARGSREGGRARRADGGAERGGEREVVRADPRAQSGGRFVRVHLASAGGDRDAVRSGRRCCAMASWWTSSRRRRTSCR